LPAVDVEQPWPKKVRLQELVEPIFVLTEDVSEDLPKGFLVADDPVLQKIRVKKGKI